MKESKPGRRLQTLIIDNYDSFTYNLCQALACINDGQVPIVLFNDTPWSEVSAALAGVDNIVLSPGPGHPERPEDIGVCKRLLTDTRIKQPILGVCMGLQAMVFCLGGVVARAAQPMHGRLSAIRHDDSELFANVPQAFQAVRYNSLLALPDSIPSTLKVTATTDTGEVMAVQHLDRLHFGVQFHPESVCTEHGQQLLKNFHRITCDFKDSQGNIDPHKRKKTHGSAVVDGNIDNASATIGSKASEHPRPVSCVDPDQHNLPAIGQGPTQTEPSDQRTTLRMRSRVIAWADPEAAYVGCFHHQAPPKSTSLSTISLPSSFVPSFWLDSSLVESERSRFSYMGDASGPLSLAVQYEANAHLVTLQVKGAEAESRTLAAKENIFQYLQQVLQSRPLLSEESAALPFDFQCGFVGYFGYETKIDSLPSHGGNNEAAQTDSPKNKPQAEPAPARTAAPDSFFLFADRILVHDHLERKCYLLALCKDGDVEEVKQCEEWMDATTAALDPKGLLAPPPLPAVVTGRTPELKYRHEKKGYIRNVEQCLEHIAAGDSYELCLTNQISMLHSPHPLLLYRRLRSINPAPYAAFLHFHWLSPGPMEEDEVSVVCSSPERFIKVDRQGWAESKPIKGTRKRGQTPAQDEVLRKQLATDPKDFSENLMIVDLIRNDLGKVSDIGSVSVPKLMDVETYATVHQLVSTVRGKISAPHSAIDVVRTAFPPGSMTGAPKLRSTHLLEAMEQGPRGVYSGCLGFLGLNGTADLNVIIRTAVCTKHGLSIGTGGAVVQLSDPVEEYDEMLLKAQALISAIASF